MEHQENLPVETPPQITPAIVTGLNNIEKGTEIATALNHIIETQKLYVGIQGKKYILVEGWNTLGAMLGCFPEVVKCVKAEREGEIFYEAEVMIKDINNRVISRSMSVCSNKERMKANADEYVIASMAQTRATGKAFRLAFSWIARLAGYEPTPAEEMPMDAPVVSVMPKAEVEPKYVEVEKGSRDCKDCHKPFIAKADYQVRCYDCWKKAKNPNT